MQEARRRRWPGATRLARRCCWRELRVAQEPPSSTGISDEELSAYLDGDLEPFRRAQVEAALRADRQLAQEARGLPRAGGGPAPDAVGRRARGAGARAVCSRSCGGRRRRLRQARRGAPPGWARWRALWPLAASLLVGVAARLAAADARLQPDEDSLLEPFVRQAVASHELFATSEDLEACARADAAALIEEVHSPFRTPIRSRPCSARPIARCSSARSRAAAALPSSSPMPATTA